MAMKSLLGILVPLLLIGPLSAQSDGGSGDSRDDAPSGEETPHRRVDTGTDTPAPPTPFRLPVGERKWTTPSGEERDVKNVAYLLDLSAAASELFTPEEGDATTRLDAMRRTLGTNLGALTPGTSFNLAGFGRTVNFRDTPVSGERERVRDASQWLATLKPEGVPLLHPLLARALSDGADQIVVLACGAPERPQDCPKDADIAAWTKDWIVKDRKVLPRVDVVGYGLSEEARALYATLAATTGGVLTVIGKPLARRPADEAEHPPESDDPDAARPAPRVREGAEKEHDDASGAAKRPDADADDREGDDEKKTEK